MPRRPKSDLSRKSRTARKSALTRKKLALERMEIMYGKRFCDFKEHRSSPAKIKSEQVNSDDVVVKNETIEYIYNDNFENEYVCDQVNFTSSPEASERVLHRKKLALERMEIMYGKRFCDYTEHSSYPEKMTSEQVNSDDVMVKNETIEYIYNDNFQDENSCDQVKSVSSLEDSERVTLDESASSSQLMSALKQSFSDIKGNIIKGKCKIIIEPGKSKVWEIFGKVKNNGIFLKDVVACKNCSTVFKFTNSTSNLVKHKCYKNVKNRSEEQMIQVDNNTKNIVADTLTEWVTTNCRPFKMVHDRGLKKYTEVILSIGEKFGSNVDTDHLLPDSTTISRHIDKLYNEVHDSLKLELRKISAFGLTSDLWTDTHLKQSFLSLTIHFIKSGKIGMKLITFQSMNFESCTGEKILQKVMAALSEFECRIEKGIIVTDSGSNMKTAFKTYDHLFCVSHMLHNIVEQSIEECSDIKEICKKCIKLVTYFKESGANAQLKTSLKSFSVTRWISIYYLLQSVEKNWIDIINILQMENQSHRISNISLNTLTDVVQILKNFEESSKELEGDSYPTLHLVIVHVYFLKRICDTKNDDLECIKSFKLKLSELINDVVIKNLTVFHKIALFLFPPTSKLLQYTNEEKNDIKQHCKIMLETMVAEQDNTNNESTSQNSLSNNREQLFSGFLQPLNPTNNLDRVQNEILLYENTNEVMHNNFDVLQWWELNKLKFPLLFKLSLKVLAVPASSASSQRVFSNASNLLSEKRCIIGSNTLTVGKIMFIHTNK